MCAGESQRTHVHQPGQRGRGSMYAGESQRSRIHQLRVGGQRRESPAHALARKARSRRLLLTTKTLDRAIAAPASIGLSSPSAASGTAAVL